MEKVYDIVKLSSIPIMLAKIMAVAEDPDSSREDLTEVIERDQTLAASVLHMANTAQYGSQRKIMTLDNAVSLMGFNAIKELAVTGTIFRELSKSSGEKMTMFWRHSFEVAKLSVSIANTDRPHKAGSHLSGRTFARHRPPDTISTLWQRLPGCLYGKH